MRVLYQNINHFGYERFWTNSNKRKKKRGGLTEAQAAVQRLAILLNVIRAASPDIISIVEVNRGTDGIVEGHLANEAACFSLMRRLNLAPRVARPGGGVRTYRLVPPIVSGTNKRSEAIGVLYDQTRIRFLGPWGWPGGTGPAQDVAALPGGLQTYGGGAVAYTVHPAALPHRVVPVGLTNAGEWEDTLAGQWHFTAAGAALDFPVAGRRRPLLTRFNEIAPNRNIDLLSFHAPPNQIPAAAAPSALGTAELANIVEMTGAVAAGDVQCIVGDFNVSLFDTVPPGAGLANVAYDGLTNAAGPNYNQLIRRDLVPGTVIPDTFPQRFWVTTHVKPSASGEPWNTNGYPGFGYMTVEDQFGRYDAIDNVFVRYGPGAAPAPTFTVINPVVGSPYNAVVAPAIPVQYQGTIVLATQLTVPGSLNSPGGIAPPFAYYRTKAFQSWKNYQKIQSTSDHMAIAVDI